MFPLEIKSGKDYKTHSALSKLLAIKEYNIRKTFVFSKSPKVERAHGLTYLPIYYISCM